MTPHLHLYVLASGSKGNAAVVAGPTGSVLVDCGISRRQLHLRADEVGCDLSRVKAILITHEHGDHVSGLSVVSKHFDGPIYATAGTTSGKRYLSELPFTLVDNDATLDLCGMRIQAFPTSHDVCDPMCFRFEVRGQGDTGDDELLDAIGWMSDTGFVTDAAFDALYGCRILCLESNHDPRMLARGPYPAYLKARVGGERGHLSNEQAAEALPALVTSDTETVVALHLSQENNRPSLAVRALANAVGAEAANTTFTEARTPNGLLRICASGQDRPMAVW